MNARHIRRCERQSDATVLNAIAATRIAVEPDAPNIVNLKASNLRVLR